MEKNSFDLSNDSLFESWKTVARLSQAMSTIEAELKKLYSLATAVSGSPRITGRPTPSLPAPAPTVLKDLEVVSAISATDVVIKKKPAKASRKVRKIKGTRPIGGNTAKLLACLQSKLTADSFVKFNQSAIAIEIGLPKGSIGASVRKLVKAGMIAEGAKGEFKLMQAIS
jgi:hypothetical protein